MRLICNWFTDYTISNKTQDDMYISRCINVCVYVYVCVDVVYMQCCWIHVYHTPVCCEIKNSIYYTLLSTMCRWNKAAFKLRSNERVKMTIRSVYCTSPLKKISNGGLLSIFIANRFSYIINFFNDSCKLDYIMKLIIEI